VVRTQLLCVAIGVVLAAPPVPAASAWAGRGGEAAGPSAIAVVAGSASGDPATLAVRDLFGPGDVSGGYLRLDPGGVRFTARFTFAALGEASDLLVALRAPAPQAGQWVIQVLGDTGWVTVWRNRAGNSGAWWGESIPLGSHPGAQVVVRVKGTGDPLYVDRLARAASPWRPVPGTTWQWQLTGVIDTSVNVAMYDVDLFDVPDAVIEKLHEDGREVVCYFSAGSWEDWRPDADAFPESLLGEPNGWPGEKWLDVTRLDRLGPIMEARLDLAVSRGCDGVEPDNVDGYANHSGFNLTATDQKRYNTWLAERAHERGLSVGLKNDLGQVRALVGLFDWALNEQCFEFDECEALLPFVDEGKAVFGVEYQGAPASFCPRAAAYGLSWLKKRPALNAWVIACPAS
jgi:hypothetical protein